jgi:hypothetical protein
MNSPGSILRFTSLRAGLGAWGYVYDRPRVSMIVKPLPSLGDWIREPMGKYSYA